MGRLFVLMGKSASGKDAVYRALIADETLRLHKVVPYTTRPMRASETEGVQYFFRTEEEYAKMLREGRIIEERSYDTKRGIWRYFTADDCQIDPADGRYLIIGTLEAYLAIRAYFGEDFVVPVYIESDDGLRLERALKRERKQDVPQYEEMCRRFLADAADFSEEKLAAAGIVKRFKNDGEIETCIAKVRAFLSCECD